MANSGGYNVSDYASGTDNSTGSGWTFGTGDTQITTETIDLSTFKPKTGSPGIDDIGILPGSLADFPATDFYGNARTFPGGAAGAVEYGY
jgi:hypothetical protein